MDLIKSNSSQIDLGGWGKKHTTFEDGIGTQDEDNLESKIKNAVEEVFPFSASSVAIYRCPNWAKALLYQYYTLNSVHEIIKLYNTSLDKGEKNLYSGEQPVT